MMIESLPIISSTAMETSPLGDISTPSSPSSVFTAPSSSSPNTVKVTSPVDVPTGTTLSPQLSSSSHTTVLGPIRSPLSDLLNLPDTPLSWKKSKTGRARVLTSSESWAILREKEEKKKRQEAEEKKENKKEKRRRKRRKKRNSAKIKKKFAKTKKKFTKIKKKFARQKKGKQSVRRGGFTELLKGKKRKTRRHRARNVQLMVTQEIHQRLRKLHDDLCVREQNTFSFHRNLLMRVCAVCVWDPMMKMTELAGHG